MPYINTHPILGERDKRKEVKIVVDEEVMTAYEGETIAATLLAKGKRILRYTRKYHKPRGIFCAIGKCTDCMMTVNGIPNIRTCITQVEEGMIIETQYGLGEWENNKDDNR